MHTPHRALTVLLLVFGIVFGIGTGAALSQAPKVVREHPPPPIRRQGNTLFIELGATAADLAILKTLPDVKKVYIAGAISGGHFDITEESLLYNQSGLAYLELLKNLEEISFGSLRVSDAIFSHLKNLSKLRKIEASGNITGTGLANLENLTELQELWLYGNRSITDDGLACLGNLKKLRVLHLYPAPITDKGLYAIRGLERLEDLQIGKSQVTDAGLAYIAGFRRLKALDLQSAPITDAGLASLRDLTKLDWLCLQNTRVGDAGMAYLQNLTDLIWLNLSDTGVGDNGIAFLSKMKKLQTLHLESTLVSDAALPLITSLPGLKTVEVSYTRMTLEEVFRFRRASSRIKILFIPKEYEPKE